MTTTTMPSRITGTHVVAEHVSSVVTDGSVWQQKPRAGAVRRRRSIDNSTVVRREVSPYVGARLWPEEQGRGPHRDPRPFCLSC